MSHFFRGGTSGFVKHVLLESANRFLSSLALSFMIAPSLRLFGASIGKNVRMYTPLVCHNTRFSNLSIGDSCHIGRGVFLDLADRISIENRVTVSMNATILTHQDVGDSSRSFEYPSVSKPTTICEGAYIGAGAIILHGVTVGPGAVVGAGAVVTRDVQAGTVVVGVPAKKVESR